MNHETAPPPRGRRRTPAAVVTASLVAIGALYVARPVLIPLALAVLVAFVLSPVVGPVERRLGRLPAVVAVSVATLALLGGLAWGVGWQINDLARDLPQHRERLRQRVAELRRTTSPPAVNELHGMVDEVIESLSPRDDPARRRAVTVVVEPAGRGFLTPSVLLPWVTGAALTMLLAVFILLERQELRNRIIRLAGFARLPLATRALDEASRRIATYLTSQLAVNGAFGAAAAIGLLLIGVPYALLWGLVAGLLRFIPFLGFWASLTVAVAASLSVSTGWAAPLLVVALFAGLGLVLMVAVEPHLYSRSAGVSRVALLMAVMALGWLWGPAGLLLATPLTVCLVVLGRHLPELKAIALILGDAPALAPHLAYYQRLLADDRDEAVGVVEAFLATSTPDRLFDALLLPALSALKADRRRNAVTDADCERIVRTTRRIVDENVPLGEASSEGRGPALTGRAMTVVGVAAEDQVDQLALEFFARLCRADGSRFTALSPELLSSEVVEAVERERPGVVCIGGTPPGGLATTRYLAKRLRARMPGAMILVGRWGGETYVDDSRAALLSAGAHDVATTLAESRRQLLPLLQLDGPAPERPGPEVRAA